MYIQPIYMYAKKYLLSHNKPIIGIHCFLIVVTEHPSLEACRTVAVGSRGEWKFGATTSCKNHMDFYGRFIPTNMKYDMRASLLVNTSLFPRSPDFIFLYGFGISDASVLTLVRYYNGTVVGNSQWTLNESMKVSSFKGSKPIKTETNELALKALGMVFQRVI